MYFIVIELSDTYAGSPATSRTVVGWYKPGDTGDVVLDGHRHPTTSARATSELAAGQPRGRVVESEVLDFTGWGDALRFREIPLAGDERLGRGRECYQRRAWREAWELLSACDSESPLQEPDLEMLAVASFLLGQDGMSDGAWTRAHQRHLQTGNRPGAVRCAFWLASQDSPFNLHLD